MCHGTFWASRVVVIVVGAGVVEVVEVAGVVEDREAGGEPKQQRGEIRRQEPRMRRMSG